MYFWTSSSVISTFRGSADVAGGAAGCAGAADADRAGDAAGADSSAFLEEQAVASTRQAATMRRCFMAGTLADAPTPRQGPGADCRPSCYSSFKPFTSEDCGRPTPREEISS